MTCSPKRISFSKVAPAVKGLILLRFLLKQEKVGIVDLKANCDKTKSTSCSFQNLCDMCLQK